MYGLGRGPARGRLVRQFGGATLGPLSLGKASGKRCTSGLVDRRRRALAEYGPRRYGIGLATVEGIYGSTRGIDRGPEARKVEAEHEDSRGGALRWRNGGPGLMHERRP